MTWRKSSRSSSNGENCVETARLRGAAAVRDSKNPGGGHLTFGIGAWRGFIAAVKQGRYDR